MLDRHKVACEADESINSFNLINGEGHGKWSDWNKIRYSCCKVAAPPPPPPITYEWIEGEWQATVPISEPYADAPCFPGNVRYHTVECQDTSTSTKVDESLCVEKKPATKENCTYVYPGEWQYSLWSDCVNNKQTRTETCSGEVCDPSKRQKTETDCLTFKWVAGTFGTCANAKQTRKVQCIGSVGAEYIGNCVEKDKPKAEQACKVAKSYLWYYIGGGAVLLIIIVIALVALHRKKNKKIM